jgi:hypothetical protein
MAFMLVKLFTVIKQFLFKRFVEYFLFHLYIVVCQRYPVRVFLFKVPFSLAFNLLIGFVRMIIH